MNIQTFLFKILMAVYYILLLAAIFTPLTVLIVYSRQGGWKYGFTFIQNSLEVGLFMGFSLAFLIGMYHVLSFELVGKAPAENYLKSKQRVKIKGPVGLADLKSKAEEQFRIKDVDLQSNVLTFRKLVYFSKPDLVQVKEIEPGLYEVESRPFAMWSPVDFGRNFKTVTQLAKMIKGLI